MQDLIRPFYWELLSKKLREKLDRLRFVGFFTEELAEKKKLRLVVGREKNLCLYWLVDEADGVIADAKFQVFGPIGLIGALEVATELVLHKTLAQASRLFADLIDQHVRDKKEIPAFPKECAPFLNQVLSAIDSAVYSSSDIASIETYDQTPIENDFGEIPGGLPGWESFPLEKRLSLIEEIIDKEIRPYIELDAGGVKLIELREKSSEVVISYEGACTSCHSAGGSTLSAIQNILKRRVHPSLVVVPIL